MSSHSFYGKHFVAMFCAGAFVLALGIQAAWAQGGPPGRGDAPPSQQGPMVSEEELESFAGAYVKIREISEKYQSRITGAEEEAKVRQLQQEANDKMAQAVQDHGLTVSEYNMIFDAIKQNARLEQQFESLLQEKGG